MRGGVGVRHAGWAIAIAATFVALVAPLPEAEGAHAALTDVEAIPYKAGRNALVRWTTNDLTTGEVVYGTSPGAWSGRVVDHRGTASRNHAVVLPSLVPGTTYHYQVVATWPNHQTVASSVESFVAADAFRAYNATATAYSVNLYVRFEPDMATSGALPFGPWVTAMGDFAHRVWDMTDGSVRLGTVVLEDNLGALPLGTPYANYAEYYGQLSRADATVITANAAVATAFVGAIDGRGVITIPFLGGADGAWWAHEFGHYAFWLLDQYGTPGGCQNEAVDVSVMDDPWLFSELDGPGATCAWNEFTGTTSWDILRDHYDQVPPRDGAPDPGPPGNGGAFRVVIVNRGR